MATLTDTLPPATDDVNDTAEVSPPISVVDVSSRADVELSKITLVVPNLARPLFVKAVYSISIPKYVVVDTDINVPAAPCATVTDAVRLS